MEEELLCPECGEPLVVELLIDKETGELIIDIGCESDEDDEFHFHILTGLTTDDIYEELVEIGEVITKQMKLVLKNRIPVLDYSDN